MPQELPRFVSEDELDELKPEAGPEHVYDDPKIAPMLRVRISQAKGNKRGRKVFSIRFGRNGRKDVAGYNSDKPGLYIRQDEFDTRFKRKGAAAVTGRTTLTMAIAEVWRVKKALFENEDPYPDRQPKKRQSSTGIAPRPAKVPKTLGELRDAWFEARQDQVDVCERSFRPPEAEDRLSQATVDDQRGVFRNHITPLWPDDKDYRKLELADVEDLIKAVRDGVTANPAARIKGGEGPAHTVSIILILMFDWAKERGSRWPITNPTIGLKIRRMISKRPCRDRWLPADELRAVWQSAAQEPYPGGPLCLLQLILFQRPGELRNMETGQIDEKEKLLKLPGWHDPEKEGEIGPNKLTEDELIKLRKARKTRRRTKTRVDYTVPLSPLAWELLNSFPRIGKYVFTYADDGSRPASKTMADRWKQRIHARAETILGRPIAPWNFHDSRRTASTTMSHELDLPADVGEFMLQHAAKYSGEGEERVKLSSTEPTYNHDKRLKKKWRGALAWDAYLRDTIPDPMFPADFKTLRPAETGFRMLPWDRAEAKRLFVEGAGKVTVKDLHRAEQLKGYTYGTLLIVAREITPRKAHTTTPEKREEAVALWDTGMSAKVIGRKLKMNTTVIMNAVKALRPPGAQRITMSARRNAKLNELVDAGRTPGEISALLGVPEGTVYRITRAKRLKMRGERDAEINRRVAAGEPMSALSTEFGIDKTTIQRITIGQRDRSTPSARQVAMAAGEKRYNGPECAAGHGTVRYVIDGTCVVCSRLQKANWRSKKLADAAD